MLSVSALGGPLLAARSRHGPRGRGGAVHRERRDELAIEVRPLDDLVARSRPRLALRNVALMLCCRVGLLGSRGGHRHARRDVVALRLLCVARGKYARRHGGHARRRRGGARRSRFRIVSARDARRRTHADSSRERGRSAHPAARRRNPRGHPSWRRGRRLRRGDTRRRRDRIGIRRETLDLGFGRRRSDALRRRFARRRSRRGGERRRDRWPRSSGDSLRRGWRGGRRHRRRSGRRRWRGRSGGDGRGCGRCDGRRCGGRRGRLRAGRWGDERRERGREFRELQAAIVEADLEGFVDSLSQPFHGLGVLSARPHRGSNLERGHHLVRISFERFGVVRHRFGRHRTPARVRNAPSRRPFSARGR